MKILVPVKRVADYNVEVRVKPDSAGVGAADVKMSTNPFNEIVVGEAVHLKEKGVVTEVVAISCEVAQYQEVLHMAVVISADRSILIEADTELQLLAVAELLKVLASREQPILILLGKQAIDDDTNQTDQMSVALAGLPRVTYVSRIDVIGGKVIMMREVDGGPETVSPTLSAAITTGLCLDEPCYVTPSNIMKAKKKSLDVVRPKGFDVDMASRLKAPEVSEPPKRSVGVMATDVATLVEKLKNETKVVRGVDDNDCPSNRRARQRHHQIRHVQRCYGNKGLQ